MSDPKPPFSFGVRLGIFMMVESAGLSAGAVSLLLAYVAYRAFRRSRARRAMRRQMRKEWMNAFQLSLRLKERTDASDSSFFICLMIAELVQAIGGLLNIQWIIDATVTEGPLCTVQGAFKQLGDVSVAFMSLVIAIQTFCVLVVRWHVPAAASKYIIGAVFLFVTLMVGISVATRTHSERGPYYGSTGLWCWIGQNYKLEKIVFEYLWMWLVASIMLVLYGITALVMRGILIVGDDLDNRWKLTWNWGGKPKRTGNPIGGALMRVDDDEGDGEERRQAKAIANLMLFYPAVYIFCVFPVGLVRWLDFSGHHIPSAATIFASFVFSLSGLLNTILYVLTRPELVKGSDVNASTVVEDEDSRPRSAKKDSTRGRGTEKLTKRTLADPHNLGHLPDRGDDDSDLYLQDHPADSPPWFTQHSRGESGYTYPASPVSSPKHIMLDRLPGAPHDTYPPNTFHEGSISPREEVAPNQAPRRQGHQQLVSLDLGHLPDLDFDRDTDHRQLQQLQIPLGRQEGERRGSGSSQGRSLSSVAREISSGSSAIAWHP